MALSVYKKGQGTAARGVAGAAGVLLGLWAGHQMWATSALWSTVARVIVTGIAAMLFGGVPLYLVLFHRGAVNVLIETQQEMRKVAWSSRAEVLASAVVVIVMVTILSLFIFATDTVLLWISQLFGIY